MDIHLHWMVNLAKSFRLLSELYSLLSIVITVPLFNAAIVSVSYRSYILSYASNEPWTVPAAPPVSVSYRSYILSYLHNHLNKDIFES